MVDKLMYPYNMRDILIILVVISVSMIASPEHSRGLTVDRVLATVGNEAITISDYHRYVKTIGAIEQNGEINEGLLRGLIEERVVLNEAVRRGVDVSDGEVNKMIEEFKEENAFSQEDFERELAKEGMSLQAYRNITRDKLLSLKLVEMDVGSRIEVTDKEIKDFYNENKKNYVRSPERAEIRVIFLKLGEKATVTEITDLKRKALKIAAKLKDGDSFEVLLKQYGDEFLKNEGGRLGEFERGALVPKLDKKAFSMKDGEVSDPIWLKEGAYILKLIHKTGETFKTIGEVQEEIKRLLYSQKRERLFNEWIKTLWENSSITIK